MRGGAIPKDICDWPPVKAVVAGLAVLCAAALAAGVFDGAPSPARPRGQAVAGGRLVAAPVVSLCFRGPGGEAVDFPATTQQQCPNADAGLHLANARP